MKLKFIEGPYPGRIIDISDREFVVGRNDDADLYLNENGVSRRHAKLYRDGANVVVEDLSSMNGVHLNGTVIKTASALAPGDEIRIGPAVLQVLPGNGDIVVAAPHSPTRSEDRSDHLPDRRAGPHYPQGLATAGWVLAMLAAIAILWLSLPADERNYRQPVLTDGDTDAPAIEATVTGTTEARTSATPETEPAAEGPERQPLMPDDQAASASPQPPPTATREPHRGATGRGVVDYLWLESVPPNAHVTLDARPVGKTTAFINGLAPGTYTLRFTRIGYEDLTRLCEVPNSGERHKYTLRLRNGVGRIDSEPREMTVMHGSQLLGQTPLILRDYQPGSYKLKISGIGYESQSVSVTIVGSRPSEVMVRMMSSTGDIRVVTVPPHAKVFVDDFFKGVSRAVSDASSRSTPLLLEGFKAGRHKIHIEYKNEPSTPKIVTINAGAVTEVYPMVWFPDVRVKRTTGDTIVGMMLETDATGTIVIARTATRHVRIPAGRVAEITEIPPHAARSIIKRGRDLRQPRR